MKILRANGLVIRNKYRKDKKVIVSLYLWSTPKETLPLTKNKEKQDMS